MGDSEEGRKFGWIPRSGERRALQLSKYLPSKQLLSLPGSVDHCSLVPTPIGYMGNNQYGDCVLAAGGHMVQSWTTYASGDTLTITDEEIIAAYFHLSPFNNGVDTIPFFDWWMNPGFVDDKVEAYVECDKEGLVEVKFAIQAFGAAYVAGWLPVVNTFGPWIEVQGPGSWYYGHAWCVLAYDDETELFKVATWGQIMDMSYAWYTAYCVETYAVLDDISLIQETGLTPEGFDWDTLVADLVEMGGTAPVPPTPPAVVPCGWWSYEGPPMQRPNRDEEILLF